MILAAQGLRNPDGGVEKIEDRALEAELRRQARKVQVQSIIAALFLTIFSFYL